MLDVPVVLFVFNRPDHLSRVLEQLRRNKIAKLYVFCDGSRGPEDEEGVAAVRKTIQEIDWVEKEVFESPKNKGLSPSIIEGLGKLFKIHERLIVVEDDIVVAPGFYNYMLKSLEYYKDEKSVYGVTGTCYPIGEKVLKDSKYDTYLERRFCSWGWGMWRRAWEQLDFDVKKLAKKYEPIQDQTASLAGSDMAMMAPMALSGELGGSWDVLIGINLLVQKKTFVWPTTNFVENDGIGTGTHTGQKPWWDLVWGKGFAGNISYPPIKYTDQKLHEAFVAFFTPRKRSRQRSVVQVAKTTTKKILKVPLPLIQKFGPRLSSLSSNDRYHELLVKLHVIQPYAVNDHIHDNLQAFLASTVPYKVAGITRPKNYQESVEILVPCHNHGMYLEEGFKAIQNQTVLPKNLTVTYINDKSTDNSLEVMERIKASSKDIRVKIINNRKNVNQAGSLNKAIRQSKSQLFVNLNADDVFTPDCLEKILQTYEQRTDIFLLGGHSLWFETGDSLPEHTIKDISKISLTTFGPSDALRFTKTSDLNMSQSSCSFFRSAWQLVGGYRAKEDRVCANDDRDFQMRVCSLLPVGIYQDYPMQFYRSDSSTRRSVR